MVLVTQEGTALEILQKKRALEILQKKRQGSIGGVGVGGSKASLPKERGRSWASFLRIAF